MIQQLCLWVLSWASLEVGYWLLSVATLLLYLIHWPFAAYIHIYIALCLSVACWLSLYAIDICYSCCPYALSDPLAFRFYINVNLYISYQPVMRLYIHAYL